MPLYSIVLFLHLVGAVTLFASLGLDWTCLRHLRSARTVDAIRTWADAATAAPPLAILAATLIVFPGIYLATKLAAWGHGWVELSLATVVVMGILGGRVGASRMHALKRGYTDAAAGPASPALITLATDPVLLTGFYIRTALGLGVVFLMATRPGVTVSLLVLGLALVAGGIVAWRLARAR